MADDAPLLPKPGVEPPDVQKPGAQSVGAQKPGAQKSATVALILSTTLDILRTRGPAAVNIEAVSAASGIAKTTIYRRYENRDALLEAAILSVVINPVPPADTAYIEQLRWVIRQSRDGVENILGMGGVSAILAGQDRQFMDLIRGMLVPWIALVRSLLVAGVASGELRADVDVDVALNFILGSSLGEFIRVGTVSDDWSERVLTMVWRMVGP
ncbi:TetR/AcrR family transcriptional regulator [Subtercola frigoramans]|uniref:AcrR family transcriptional regulator n=1 Tax=Subtercola frigoramans TaxID=120298 RepID=A0ABS2L1Q1_9MICO|nr:TetR family transcriptional regulator [Subtercola frigoramans]MBM7470949.1 AcrR family transcriptional regulator [Subtercola frigoramans]